MTVSRQEPHLLLPVPLLPYIEILDPPLHLENYSWMEYWIWFCCVLLRCLLNEWMLILIWITAVLSLKLCIASPYYVPDTGIHTLLPPFLWRRKWRNWNTKKYWRWKQFENDIKHINGSKMLKEKALGGQIKSQRWLFPRKLLEGIFVWMFFYNLSLCSFHLRAILLTHCSKSWMLFLNF